MGQTIRIDENVNDLGLLTADVWNLSNDINSVNQLIFTGNNGSGLGLSNLTQVCRGVGDNGGSDLCLECYFLPLTFSCTRFSPLRCLNKFFLGNAQSR